MLSSLVLHRSVSSTGDRGREKAAQEGRQVMDGLLPCCMILKGSRTATEGEENPPNRPSQCGIKISEAWRASAHEVLFHVHVLSLPQNLRLRMLSWRLARGRADFNLGPFPNPNLLPPRGKANTNIKDKGNTSEINTKIMHIPWEREEGAAVLL